VDEVVQDALQASARYRRHQEGDLWKDWHLYSHVALKCERLTEEAWKLGRKHRDRKSIRAELYELAVQDFFADAAESLAIAVAMLTCAEGDLLGSIVGAIGFGRDNDSSAAIAGSIAGALNGYEGIDRDLILQCEAANPGPTCAQYASDLHRIVAKQIERSRILADHAGSLL
jgi:ADP-ribosylglycohydrolase